MQEQHAENRGDSMNSSSDDHLFWERKLSHCISVKDAFSLVSLVWPYRLLTGCYTAYYVDLFSAASTLTPLALLREVAGLHFRLTDNILYSPWSGRMVHYEATWKMHLHYTSVCYAQGELHLFRHDHFQNSTVTPKDRFGARRLSPTEWPRYNQLQDSCGFHQ